MGFSHDASKRGVSSEHEIDMAPTFVSVRRHGGLRGQKARATHGIAARSRSSGRATGGSTIEQVFDLMALSTMSRYTWRQVMSLMPLARIFGLPLRKSSLPRI
jgi:hypothetical protein